jgi:SAM-dependent methyltransferase
VETAEYARMQHHDHPSWWHVGRLEIIRQELARQLAGHPGHALILEGGCGTESTVAMLSSLGVVENVRSSAETLAVPATRALAGPGQADRLRLPYPDGHFDLVGAFDVLEHIRDDAAALAEWRRVLRPGGRIVLTVPAYPWLWSGHDVALHHHRRYGRRDLVALARCADLEVVKVSYAIVFSLPLVAASRLLAKLRRRPASDQPPYAPLPAPVNRLFTRLLKAEAGMHARRTFPAGTSLLAVLTR